MKQAALFLSPESPYPLAGGGSMRSASLLNFLARDHAVDVITFREPHGVDPRLEIPGNLTRNVHVIELPAHARNGWARTARNAGRLLRRVPPLMDRFAGFGEQIRNATKGKHYEIAVIEHFWCAPYWEQVAELSDMAVLDLHNVESILHERCAQSESGTQALAHRAFQNITRQQEEKWLPPFTYLLAASEDDAVTLRGISPRSNVLIYPNSIPLTAPLANAEEDVIVFSGNLEYHPNISAVRYFHSEIWPALRAKWPGLVWRLVGKNPQAVENIVKVDSRIEVTGPVADAIPELARAKVAIVPLLAGSGTRLKIIEAWAAGVPVVSTSIGAEGLGGCNGEHLLLADSATAFAEAVSRLLESKALRRRIGCAGRYLFECEFTWERAWQRLQFIYPATMVRSDALRD